MNQPVPVAVAPPPAPLGLPFLPSAPSYNITLNLTAILSFLPSRLRSRILKKAFDYNIVSAPNVHTLPATSVASLEAWAASASSADNALSDILSSDAAASRGATAMKTLGSATATHVNVPSPWGFFISSYMLGLFIMAFLLHRMQNVLIPSRRMRHRQRHAVRRARPVSFTNYFNIVFLRRLFSSVLPLNLSRTSTRLVLHAPSLYFLSKMLLMWFLLVLQTSELFPAQEALSGRWGLEWIGSLGAWSRDKDMSEICWATFCAICAAFVVEGFVRSLDGIGSGFPLGGSVNPNTSPFNLVGYAFLLHLYSSPVMHTHTPEKYPSRPDKHVIITIAIPLLQLTIFHILSISKRLSIHRLIPTALTSILSLLHFHLTIFSRHFFSSTSSLTSSSPSHTVNAPPPSSASPNIDGGTLPNLTSARVVPSYPILNYVPNIFETALIIVIIVTILTNAIAQLLVRGRVERLFNGLGLGLGGGTDDDSNGFHLPYDEDFGILLLRMGTASLEATGLRGWGNEVAPIAAPVHQQHQHRVPAAAAAIPAVQNEYGIVRMGRTSVGSVFAAPVGASTYALSTTRRRGLRHEVRTVEVGIQRGREDGKWWRWMREAWKFVLAFWGVVKGLLTWAWAVARSGGKDGLRLRRGGGPAMEEERHHVLEEDREEEEDEKDEDRVVYERFLMGENISDDDGGEYEDREEDEVGEEEEDEGSLAEEEEDEAVGLFTDLVRGTGAAVGGEMVLAHLLHGSSPRRASGANINASSPGPLTRRRWDTLFAASREEDTQNDNGRPLGGRVQDFNLNMDQRDPERENSARNWCVVCTCEPREIICWPCRCLSMCDSCREALASRSAPVKHRCPCCRQLVDGYSRIYIP